MRDTDKLSVTVQRLGSAGGEYVAFFRSDLYGAMFCVSFPDSMRRALLTVSRRRIPVGS